MEIIQSAYQALKINKLRTSLTMLGIVIGITSVILIYSLGQGAVAFITDELSSFGTNYFQINPGKSQISTFAGSDTLTIDDYETIKNDISISNIEKVAPIALTSVVVSANGEDEELLVYGTTGDIATILKPDIVEGEFLTDEQEYSIESVAVLGKDAAKTFFGEETPAVDETITIQNKTFRVSGVISSSSILAGGFLNNAVFIPLSVVVNEISGSEALQEIDISVKDENSINQTIEDVENLLRNQHDLAETDDNDFQIQSAQDILTTTKVITSLLIAMVSAISGIALVVGGVGVMNIMLVSVTERTREIGLLKAIGAKDSDIMIQFLYESMFMSVVGGITGVILGISLAFIVSLLFSLPFIVSLPAIIIAVAVSTGIGLVFGLYPAKRAAKLSPIDALQYQ